MASQKIYQPHPALKPYIRYYWTLDIQLTEKSLLDLHVVVDRFPRIVIQCLNGKNALHSAHYEKIFAASLKGVTSKPALVQMESTYTHVAVSFYPHGLKALFGIDGNESINGVFNLHDFFPHDALDKMMEARNNQARISLLESCLLKRLNKVSAIDSRVIDFLGLCPATHYGKRLKEYAISERQFERKFLRAIGFTPSYYRRVLRFEKAFNKIQHGHYSSLADLAYESGYADQSHFNKEFKQFSGSTPLLLTAKVGIAKESGSIVAG